MFMRAGTLLPGLLVRFADAHLMLMGIVVAAESITMINADARIVTRNILAAQGILVIIIVKCIAQIAILFTIATAGITATLIPGLVTALFAMYLMTAITAIPAIPEDREVVALNHRLFAIVAGKRHVSAKNVLFVGRLSQLV